MLVTHQPELRQTSTTIDSDVGWGRPLVFPELLLTSGTHNLQQRDDLRFFHLHVPNVMFHVGFFVTPSQLWVLYPYEKKLFQKTSIEQGILIRQAQDTKLLNRQLVAIYVVHHWESTTNLKAPRSHDSNLSVKHHNRWTQPYSTKGCHLKHQHLVSMSLSESDLLEVGEHFGQRKWWLKEQL